MKLSSLGFLLISFFLMTSCATRSPTQVNQDLLKETWIQKINVDTRAWTRNADYWFLTGEPNQIERYNQKASPEQATTIAKVRVPNFTTIQVEAPYQVQIMGHQDNNSVYVLGPNEQTQHVSVGIRNGVLFLRQTDNCQVNKMDPCKTDRVIVRVGIRNLSKLNHNGSGLIQGRDVSSDRLIINSTNSGVVMMDGYMNLAKINQFGTGTITILGAETPALSINVKGNGNVNVGGHVGVHVITHDGDGQVNVIGADTNALVINASCRGTTSVVGYSNLKRVNAIGMSRVYVYWVNSNGTYVFARDKARVGLAGATQNLNVETTQSARYLGKYLRGKNVYARTQDWSHANVNPEQKLFAVALDESSIYFMGTPKIISRYTEHNGVILPVWDEAQTLPMTNYRPGLYKQPGARIR